MLCCLVKSPQKQQCKSTAGCFRGKDKWETEMKYQHFSSPLATQLSNLWWITKLNQAARFLTWRKLKLNLFFPSHRAYANLRQSSLDGMTTSRGHHSHHHKPRSSSSETNLRKLTMGEFGGGLAGLGAGGSAPPGGRPGSALGLLQGRTRGEQNLTLRHLPDTLYLVTQSSSSIYYHSLCHVDDAIFCQFVEITYRLFFWTFLSNNLQLRVGEFFEKFFEFFL